MSRQREWIALTLVLLVAAGLRLSGLGDVPPGLSHDEVANWVIARDILDGNHAIYFTAAYGHEPLYQYAQAATVALFGDHWLGLRWPSVAFGLLGLAATYALVRYLFGVRVALLTSAWVAVSFWPLFYARVAYRAIQLPFLAALGAHSLMRVILRPPERNARLSRGGSGDVLAAGFLFGLSFYTYTAARMLPFILVAVVAHAKLVRPRVSVAWSEILAIFFVAAFVAAPLLLWLAAHPGAESRVAEVRQPLDRLLAGDLSLVWQNLIANLKFFTFSGDPWPRYNLPGRPVFAEPIGAGLFLAGLGIALWRWRDPRFGFLLAWLVGSLGPSVITSRAPSSIRNSLGLVVAFVFPALALVELERWAGSRLSSLSASIGQAASILPSVLVVLALVPGTALTARDYFVRWPRHEVVRFDYQADLTAVGERLERLPADAAVTVSGLSVHTMDAPTLELVSSGDVADVRLCDTRETLLVPSSPSAGSWILIPQVVPLDEDLRGELLDWGARETHALSFTTYRLLNHQGLRQAPTRLNRTVNEPDGTLVQLPVSFGGRLTFLGYRVLDRTRLDEPLTLLTCWRVEEPPSAQVKVFAHLVRASGEVVAQDDGLASPSTRWQANDIVIQKHILTPPDVSHIDDFTVHVGIYEQSTGNRLPVLDTDYLQLDLPVRE